MFKMSLCLQNFCVIFDLFKTSNELFELFEITMPEFKTYKMLKI